MSYCWRVQMVDDLIQLVNMKEKIFSLWAFERKKFQFRKQADALKIFQTLWWTWWDHCFSWPHKTGSFSECVAKVEPSQSLSSPYRNPIFPEALNGKILRHCWPMFFHLMRVGNWMQVTLRQCVSASAFSCLAKSGTRVNGVPSAFPFFILWLKCA